MIILIILVLMSESTPLVSLNIHKNIPTSTTASSRFPQCCVSRAAHLRVPVKIGNHDHNLSELYDVTNAIGSMTIKDTDDLEADLLMELARARQEVFRAEKSLANCVVREHEVLANLSKFKSSISKRKLDKADVGLGYMRIAFKKHGLSHQALPHALDGSYIESQAASQNITIQLD
ncbi:uncharacterized protein F5147DRAFT_784188 [Suillus discolor]|uniref:Uncharacterized protein n=1 Tax=Suillus discolor TaxID=1912936 RepID=A0A9P7JKH9_9AGAM|nr:uncharacterized protein F5147DRAFT_784188 [Suillus discolor]KAG2080577.1 hypothetical protein F5147DRAFT_784188 [Suillus discolor]